MIIIQPDIRNMLYDSYNFCRHREYSYSLRITIQIKLLVCWKPAKIFIAMLARMQGMVYLIPNTV